MQSGAILPRIRDGLAIVFLGACLLDATLNHLTDVVAFDWFRDTSVRMNSLRLTANTLRSLGASGEEITYLADPPADAAYYFGLQYQMLPSILTPSGASPFVILRTANPSSLLGHERLEHLTLMGDAGNGFYLLRRTAR